ncbi:hypothetical protein CIRG_09998 [Coccidioides immitis RMSCC 2394]|uniref:Uncharacterized protein n=1 Tax=Coccidioides immitis RMSCC 2394 TaxID=404692 RepID=A0A0J6Y362_COCIT|nr:hypothetical protein CIRG_09998 [Coccidioides immitis RMSCC 2394]
MGSRKTLTQTGRTPKAQNRLSFKENESCPKRGFINRCISWAARSDVTFSTVLCTIHVAISLSHSGCIERDIILELAGLNRGFLIDTTAVSSLRNAVTLTHGYPNGKLSHVTEVWLEVVPWRKVDVVAEPLRETTTWQIGSSHEFLLGMISAARAVHQTKFGQRRHERESQGATELWKCSWPMSPNSIDNHPVVRVVQSPDHRQHTFRWHYSCDRVPTGQQPVQMLSAFWMSPIIQRMLHMQGGREREGPDQGPQVQLDRVELIRHCCGQDQFQGSPGLRIATTTFRTFSNTSRNALINIVLELLVFGQ